MLNIIFSSLLIFFIVCLIFYLFGLSVCLSVSMSVWLIFPDFLTLLFTGVGGSIGSLDMGGDGIDILF